MIEFQKYGSTERLNRTTWVTEKINGTNAGIVIRPRDETPGQGSVIIETDNHGPLEIAFQSRNRLITPKEDNAGFARWANAHIFELAENFGPGRHFGEWWGPGIQGNPYRATEKKFSLFHALHWYAHSEAIDNLMDYGVEVVPLISVSENFVWAVQDADRLLRAHGSFLAPWDSPQAIPAEGYVVHHQASRSKFKVLLEDDDISKTEAGLK